MESVLLKEKRSKQKTKGIKKIPGSLLLGNSSRIILTNRPSGFFRPSINFTVVSLMTVFPSKYYKSQAFVNEKKHYFCTFFQPVFHELIHILGFVIGSKSPLVSVNIDLADIRVFSVFRAFLLPIKKTCVHGCLFQKLNCTKCVNFHRYFFSF